MTTQKEALKLALDALENTYALRDDVIEAITAIKEALAQPEQGCDYCNHALYAGTNCKNCGKVTLKPKQEPVAWIYSVGKAKALSMNYVAGVRATPLYTTPPQRKPLTDDEIASMWVKAEREDSSWVDFSYKRFVRAIEAAHGIKE